MEDNTNKEIVNDIPKNNDNQNESVNHLVENNSSKTVNDDHNLTDNIEDNSLKSDIQNNDDTKNQDIYMRELYDFYKSKHENRQTISCVNKATVTIFIIFICMCLVIFISCMVIDFSNPNLNSATIGDSSNQELLETETNSNNYDFSKNDGIIINQYNPPERDDSMYMNEDGSYTIAGVAKYASDSIISIYVSTDAKTLNGMGSGIIFSDEGYILTNAHVVKDANYIVGILNDETRINLSLVGMDTELDIAVLQSDNKNIPVATMGNSDSVILGEQVVAIGNPAGLTGTVTWGIVSSINRKYTTSDNVNRAFIQTDTAISPGNSGGALLNMYGQVIGITSLKISEDQTYEGLGFAICINDALECAQNLIKNRFKIGIEFNSSNNEIEITKIVQSCSIAQTQLQVGDIITELNGQPVSDYSTVMSNLEGSKPGDVITAKVQRRNNGLINEFYIEFQLMPYDN